MKLIIQVPCYNERQALPETLADLPREVEGFDRVEWLVVDDGSTDGTAEVALAHGVDHVVRMNGNEGLARAFMAGLEAAVERGADVIVNSDADNQYRAAGIRDLTRPILAGEADLVVGARPIATIRHFSAIKRLLQWLGSAVVRSLSSTEIRDAPSGFRALSRDTALRLNVFNSYTYTIETIIQAGRSNLRVINVPIEVNQPTRPSRLISSLPAYVWKSMGTILSAYLIYRPVRIFGLLAAIFLAAGALLAVRYLWLAYVLGSLGHVQSVIASGVLALAGVLMAAFGVAAHLLAINRRLLEELRYLERSRSATRPAPAAPRAAPEAHGAAAEPRSDDSGGGPASPGRR